MMQTIEIDGRGYFNTGMEEPFFENFAASFKWDAKRREAVRPIPEYYSLPQRCVISEYWEYPDQSFIVPVSGRESADEVDRMITSRMRVHEYSPALTRSLIISGSAILTGMGMFFAGLFLNPIVAVSGMGCLILGIIHLAWATK